jgi:hypothetical protein
MSKVLEKTSVQVNDSKKNENPRDKFKKILSELDIAKEHTVKIHLNSKIVQSWKIKFKKNGSNYISIFRSAGGWQTFQNKESKC